MFVVVHIYILFLHQNSILSIKFTYTRRRAYKRHDGSLNFSMEYFLGFRCDLSFIRILFCVFKLSIGKFEIFNSKNKKRKLST